MELSAVLSGVNEEINSLRSRSRNDLLAIRQQVALDFCFLSFFWSAGFVITAVSPGGG
jgi:hypothetical protein